MRLQGTFVHSCSPLRLPPYPAWIQGQEDLAPGLAGMVLLASAYHMPDGGHPVFSLPIPILRIIQPILSRVFRSKAVDAHADPAIVNSNARTNSRNPTHMIKAFYNQLRWVEGETVAELTVPSIIVHGETDAIIPLEQARVLAASLQRTYLYVLRQTGHQVMQERPAATLDCIMRFLEDLEAGQPPGTTAAKTPDDEGIDSPPVDSA
jgi:pimeloyl-ACP methyl ester carboxylesterase